MSFEQNIQQWVSVDNQIKILTERLKELRDKKSALCENILQHAEKNNMATSTIQISDGKLKFAQTRVASPLTFKYLEKSLSEVIRNENQVKQIVEYVKNKRDIKVVPEIKRYSNN